MDVTAVEEVLAMFGTNPVGAVLATVGMVVPVVVAVVAWLKKNGVIKRGVVQSVLELRRKDRPTVGIGDELGWGGAGSEATRTPLGVWVYMACAAVGNLLAALFGVWALSSGCAELAVNGAVLVMVGGAMASTFTVVALGDAAREFPGRLWLVTMWMARVKEQARDFGAAFVVGGGGAAHVVAGVWVVVATGGAAWSRIIGLAGSLLGISYVSLFLAKYRTKEERDAERRWQKVVPRLART